MGIPINPVKVKLFTGLLFHDIPLFEDAKRRLESVFGSTDFESGLLDFTHTHYYDAEFGPDLKRKFLGFSAIADLQDIYKVKLKTNSLEKRYSKHGRRAINIDPGYLDLAKVVLFSTKDYSHRIYLKKGIFAEVTLFYKESRYNPWPWTYPDYKTAAYAEIFDSLRSIYKAQRR